MDIEFIWNETLADQVRAETQRAMDGQAEDIRNTAEQFDREADRQEEQADRLEEQAERREATLPIMTTVERTRTSTNSEGVTTTRTVSVRVIDMAATADARASIQAMREEAREMRQQAEEVRRAAEELRRVADELDAFAKKTDELFRELFELTLLADMTYAAKMLAIKEQIAAYINKMMALRDSFGGESSNPFTACDVSSLIGSAIGSMGLTSEVFCPTLAQVVAGIQRASKDIFDPINSATGNFYYSKGDIVIPGRYPLMFTRFYNAIGGLNSVLGANWTHNFNIQLYDNGDQVHIVFDDGHVESYTKRSNDTYSPPINRTNVLTRPEDGGPGFVLYFQNLQRYIFDENGALFRILDENGLETTFMYEGKFLKSVSNTCGSLTFAYNEDSRLSKVTDHAGRSAKYEYVSGQLTKVTHPSGAVFQYEYETHGMISKVIDPLGTAIVHNEYDSEGRTIVQHMADGGVAQMAYDDENMTTTIVEQNGNKVVHYRDKYFRTVRSVYADFEENYIYDTTSTLTGHTDRNNNTWWYVFDDFGNITRKVDPLGNAVIAEYNIFNKPTKLSFSSGGHMDFTYDEYGGLTSSVDLLGRPTRCTNDEYGRMHTITMPDLSEFKLGFDNKGNVSKTTDSMGTDTHYEYNDLNQVVKAINGNGIATSFEYSANGNITKVTDAMGNSRQYEYNLAGMVTSITDFDGAVIKYDYDKMGNLVEITDPTGASTKATFDIMQNTTSVTDYNGHTVFYEYDEYNRIIKTIDKEDNATTYEHDNNGNVTAVISSVGARTEITYDALNRHTQIMAPDGAKTLFVYDNAGNMTQITDALGNTTTRVYDIAGQVTKLIDALGNKTQFTYTSLGQTEKVINAKGECLTYEYYPGGRLKSVVGPCGETEHYEYDKTGNLVKISDSDGNETRLVYDILDRVVESINPLGHSKKFIYNVAGHMTHVINENGHTTQYKYSAIGNVVEVIDATGHSTKFDYDNMGRMTKHMQHRILNDAHSGARHTESQITTYERNRNGQVVAVTSPIGDVLEYVYDKAGRITSYKDEEGLETLYDYNLAGNLAKISYADGRSVEFLYNPLRQLSEMRDWLGTTKVETDVLGRTTSVTDHSGNTVGYTWGPTGRQDKLVYPDGSEVAYEYTETGNISKVVSGKDVTSYMYDQAGRLTARVLPDNTRTTYAFNPLGTLSNLTHSKDGNILDSFTYAYDPSGNITQIEKHRPGITSDTGLFNYAYDPLNRLIEATSTHGTKSYAYDALGNRVFGKHDGIATNHKHNARNQLVETIENDVLTEYMYDKRGNLTHVVQDGNLEAKYSYDSANMMVSAFAQDRGSAQYVYNGFKSRVQKLENLHADVSTNMLIACNDIRYINDMTRPYSNLLAMHGTDDMKTSQGTQSQKFVWGNTILSACSGDNGNSTHYLHDHLGSPIRLLGEGSASTVQAYGEFGVPVTDNIAGMGVGTFDEMGRNIQHRLDNPFGFTGYQTDYVSGFYYAQARYYQAHLGRFVSEDPARDQLNWYDYCHGNPVNFIDPRGLYRIRMQTRGSIGDETTGLYGPVCVCLTCPCPEPVPATYTAPIAPVDAVPPSTGTAMHSSLIPDLGRPHNGAALSIPDHILDNYRTATTTTLHFSTQLGENIRDAVGLLPGGFGGFLNHEFDRARFFSGASMRMDTFSKDYLFDSTKSSLPKEVKPIFSAIYYTYALFKFFDVPKRVQMDGIAQGFFQQNNIPTSHTVYRRDGQTDYTAAALLAAQMDAAYSFIFDNYNFFFGAAVGEMTWFEVYRTLMLYYPSSGLVNAHIQGILDRHESDLHASALRNNTILLTQSDAFQNYREGLRHEMSQFTSRLNFLNTQFTARIASATCNAMSHISPSLTIFPVERAPMLTDPLRQTSENENHEVTFRLENNQYQQNREQTTQNDGDSSGSGGGAGAAGSNDVASLSES